MSLKLGKLFAKKGKDVADKDEDYDLELQDHHDPTINVSFTIYSFHYFLNLENNQTREEAPRVKKLR